MKKLSGNNSQNEDLEMSAPLLFDLKSKMSSNSGFVTPENYFSSLPVEVLKRIEAFPDFDKGVIENPFNAPEGYFDALPTLIQQRIIDQDKKRNRFSRLAEIFLQPIPKYALAFACLFFVLFFSIKYFTRTIKVEYVNAAADEEQLDSFYLSQLDETVLTDAYTEQNVTTNDQQDNGIENYLLENNIDINSISEHL